MAKAKSTLILLACMALAACVEQHRERKIVADCTPRAWLYRDDKGALFVGPDPDFAQGVSSNADLAQVCAALQKKEAPRHEP